MVTDYTVYKGTSKCHKMDEKKHSFCVASSSLLIFFNYLTTLSTLLKM